jgi:hypothetical protein
MSRIFLAHLSLAILGFAGVGLLANCGPRPGRWSSARARCDSAPVREPTVFNGAADLLEVVFSEPISFGAGRAVASGNVTSRSSGRFWVVYGR